MTTSLCIPITNPDTSVVKLEDIPRPGPGAVCPLVIATEHCLVLGFFESWEEWVVVVFDGFLDYSFGMPSEDTFESHPLCQLGAEPFNCYRVTHSPWIDLLEQSERACFPTAPAGESSFNHYLIGMHDSMFECVSKGYTVHKYVGFNDQRTGYEHMMKHFEFSG